MNSPSADTLAKPLVRPLPTAARWLPPRAALLTNGRYRVQLNSTGSGSSQCRGLCVTRASRDESLDIDGFHIYLRDLADNSVWSTGYQPTVVTPDEYEFFHNHHTIQIRRVDRAIESHLLVGVHDDFDCELRRCRLTNLDRVPRTIEVTSYIELTLNSSEADANHPAFSKLFVETEWCQESAMIRAKRRRRSPHENEHWAFHTILTHNHLSEAPVEFETNRKRFIGRGATLARPQAFAQGQRLTGDWGAVLDPIASLRTVIQLAPGESRDVIFALGAEQSREGIAALCSALADISPIIRSWDEASSRALDTQAQAESQFNDVAPANRFITNPAPHFRLRDSHVDATNGDNRPFAPHFVANRSTTVDTEHAVKEPEQLLFENGYGGFAPDGREYVVRLPALDHQRHLVPPQPWCNVVANEHGGFLVSERGAGYTWVGNSRLNRLTAWHNDPVCDPHSEAFWFRDDDSGSFWSPTPGPTPADADYEVRHGFGYTSFHNASHELDQQLTLFMAPDAPLKVALFRVTNRSARRRRLSLYAYVHWALGGLAADTSSAIRTTFDRTRSAQFATNPKRERYGDCVAFSAPVFDAAPLHAEIACSADRGAFLGPRGLAAPAAVASGDRLSGASDEPPTNGAAWRVSLELAPGESREVAFLLGEVATQSLANTTIDTYRELSRIRQALKSVERRWNETLSAITIETPDPEIDVMVNGWLVYQNLSCRIWGRSAYYQPGGAYGFRDQLQDSAALVFHAPQLTRRQIVLHASQQFVEGDVLHWWHPDSGYGLRTRFSDDLLWLPLITAEYVRATGDQALLDEVAPLLEAELLQGDEQEKYLLPRYSGQHASIYEHCCRALDRGLTTGPHGLPLIGCGDWNDGMNRVGQAGRGESIWLGFFICHVLDAMLPICRERGDMSRADRYEAYRQQLCESLNASGWDGGWYRRAIYDNGQPVGSAASDECQIDAIAQAWAVISGAATPDRAALAMKGVETHLIDDDAGIIRLLTPPFNHTPNDPGYIKGYLPGIRENGGQYTHGVLWVVRAMAELGRGTRAAQLLRMLSPVSHTKTSDDVATYQTEPYVVAADVYGAPPHVGRGGWTWYTGSAGWMLRVAIESLFGLRLEAGSTLVVNPCISREWPHAQLRYRLPDSQSTYRITIENPDGREHGVREATLDGAPLLVDGAVARIPLARDGREHEVVVRL